MEGILVPGLDGFAHLGGGGGAQARARPIEDLLLTKDGFEVSLGFCFVRSEVVQGEDNRQRGVKHEDAICDDVEYQVCIVISAVGDWQVCEWSSNGEVVVKEVVVVVHSTRSAAGVSRVMGSYLRSPRTNYSKLQRNSYT